MSSVQIPTKQSWRLQPLLQPTGRSVLIPSDMRIVFPEDGTLSPQERCTLAYIPWNDGYVRHIPAAYRQFFNFVLPHMHARTTNVHTALSVAQLDSLLTTIDGPVDTRTVYLALILHDIGWSKISLRSMADSLSYSGLDLPERSRIAKQQHIEYGVELAAKLLDEYDFGDAPLSAENKRHIIEIIHRHDHDAPWEQGKHDATSITLETYLVCDADRLWSYTHENFWQDTIRKSVAPGTYLTNISNAISTYFFTDAGRQRAHELVAERTAEVMLYTELQAGRQSQ